MDKILSLTLSYILLYKYLGLFILVFLGTLMVPVPSNMMMIAVGYFSSQGYMDLPASLTAAISANVLGDICGYLIFWRYGKVLLQRISRRRKIGLDGLGVYIKNYAGGTIIVTRFVGALAGLVNIVCGLAKYSFKKFVLADIVGNILSIAIMMVAGILVGQYWDQTSDIVYWASLGLSAVLVIFIAYKIVAWRRAINSRPAA